VKTILSAQADIEVVGEAGDGKEAVEQTIRLYPHVVLDDISMPVLKGFGCRSPHQEGGPDVKVLILTVYDDEDLVARCLDAGAAGYVLKTRRLCNCVCDPKPFTGPAVLESEVLTGVVRQYISQPGGF